MISIQADYVKSLARKVEKIGMKHENTSMAFELFIVLVPLLVRPPYDP